MKNGKRYSKFHSIKNGEKFGRLTIISYTDRDGKKGEYKCLCECGNVTYAKTYSLKNGKTKSCGCLAKEMISKRNLLPNNMGIVNDVYRGYKQSAKRRGYIFDISKYDFKYLIESSCHYCGEESSLSPHGYHKDSTYRHNGVDRIDNNIGYLKTNVVPCCKICNNSKSNLSTEDFTEWIIKVYKKIVKDEKQNYINE